MLGGERAGDGERCRTDSMPIGRGLRDIRPFVPGYVLTGVRRRRGSTWRGSWWSRREQEKRRRAILTRWSRRDRTRCSGRAPQLSSSLTLFRAPAAKGGARANQRPLSHSTSGCAPGRPQLPPQVDPRQFVNKPSLASLFDRGPRPLVGSAHLTRHALHMAASACCVVA